MTLIALYLIAGSILARRRILDIALDAERSGSTILSAAIYVVSWPAWLFGDRR